MINDDNNRSSSDLRSLSELQCGDHSLGSPYARRGTNRRQTAAFARPMSDLLAVLDKQSRVGVTSQDYSALAPATGGPGT